MGTSETTIVSKEDLGRKRMKNGNSQMYRGLWNPEAPWAVWNVPVPISNRTATRGQVLIEIQTAKDTRRNKYILQLGFLVGTLFLKVERDRYY